MLSSLVPYQRAVSRDASTWYKGSLVTFLAESKDTGGSFALLEAAMKSGNEPPPHIHEREDELFYVLEGVFDVFVGDEAFKVQAGGCVFCRGSGRTGSLSDRPGFVCSRCSSRAASMAIFAP